MRASFLLMRESVSLENSRWRRGLIPGYPKFESWSANCKHYWQALTTGCLLSKTNGSSARFEVERAKEWETCERDDKRGSLTAQKRGVRGREYTASSVD